MTALYIIATEYRDAAMQLADLDLDPQTVSDTLESLSGALEVKAQSVAYMVRNLEVTAAAIKQHEAEQKARRQAIENRADSLRAYLARCMEATGIEKIEGPGVKLSFRKSSAVVVDAEDLIPAEYMRTKPAPPPEPDKAAIAAALKAGEVVPGVHIEARKSLQIA